MLTTKHIVMPKKKYSRSLSLIAGISFASFLGILGALYYGDFLDVSFNLFNLESIQSKLYVSPITWIFISIACLVLILLFIFTPNNNLLSYMELHTNIQCKIMLLIFQSSFSLPFTRFFNNSFLLQPFCYPPTYNRKNTTHDYSNLYSKQLKVNIHLYSPILIS